jgi:O-antigen ligase
MASAMKAASREGAGDQIWAFSLSVWLTLVVLFGGTSFPSSPVQTVITLSSLLFIAVGLWRLRLGMPSGAARVGVVLAALAMFLVLAQLVPIPFEFWRGLPGRELMAQSFEALGTVPEKIALSLSPLATQKSAISLLPPLAAFLGVLSVPRRAFWYLSAAICMCAIIGSGIGIVQRSQGVASGLFFYADTGSLKLASGTFANRNFFGAQLYTSIPFLAALAMSMAQKWKLRPAITFTFTLIYLGMLVAVLAAVGSRAVTLLAMPSVLLTFVLIYSLSQDNSARRTLGKGFLVTLIGLVVMAQASMIGILRLAETDPLKDSRTLISAVSFEAARNQFPYGSGFGTFVPVYQLYETPETIRDAYINHAHNEWLEVAIEGGAPALALVGVFLLWLAYVSYKALRLARPDPSSAHIKAGGVAVILLLLHAIVDFPFRTDAMMVIFGLSLGFLSLATAVPSLHPRQSRPAPVAREPTPASPSRKPRGFAPTGRQERPMGINA